MSESTPTIKNIIEKDAAVWKRIKIIPFTPVGEDNTIEEVDSEISNIEEPKSVFGTILAVQTANFIDSNLLGINAMFITLECMMRLASTSEKLNNKMKLTASLLLGHDIPFSTRNDTMNYFIDNFSKTCGTTKEMRNDLRILLRDINLIMDQINNVDKKDPYIDFTTAYHTYKKHNCDIVNCITELRK